MRPAWIGSSRFTQRSSVLFPLPLGPMTTSTSPSATLRSIPSRTRLSPKLLCTPSRRTIDSGAGSPLPPPRRSPQPPRCSPARSHPATMKREAHRASSRRLTTGRLAPYPGRSSSERRALSMKVDPLHHLPARRRSAASSHGANAPLGCREPRPGSPVHASRVKEKCVSDGTLAGHSGGPTSSRRPSRHMRSAASAPARVVAEHRGGYLRPLRARRAARAPAREAPRRGALRRHARGRRLGRRLRRTRRPRGDRGGPPAQDEGLAQDAVAQGGGTRTRRERRHRPAPHRARCRLQRAPSRALPRRRLGQRRRTRSSS